MRLAAAALVAAALAAAAPAQAMAVATVDGEMLRGAVLGYRPAADDGGALEFEATAADGTRTRRLLRLRDVLSLHRVGAVPRSAGSTEVYLVGGERLHGDVTAGESSGETFGLSSPSFGPVQIPTDRLAVMLFRERAGDARAEDFVIPSHADADEALFRRASRMGFSRVLGGIHRFRAESVLFEVEDGGAVEPFRYEDLVAIALRGGIGRTAAPEAFLLTLSGDRVGVQVLGFDAGAFRFAIEGADREFSLGLEDIAALTMSTPGRRYLADLEIAAADERPFFGESDGALLPRELDHDVMGGALVSGDLAFGKGIGVHSRSVLTWRIPEGARTFHTHVGIDDSSTRLGLRAAVRIEIRLDDRVVFEREVLRATDGAVNTGLIELAGAELLTLEVDFGPGFDLADRVNWLGAVLLN